MRLVLDLVLERADVDVLLNCLFINKRIHGMIVTMIHYELTIIKRMSPHYRGDVYQAIWHSHTSEGEMVGYKYNETTHHRMVKIYGKLYEFNMDHSASYIRTGVMFNPGRFISDMCILLADYYHKIPSDIIIIIFQIIFRRCSYDRICSCVTFHLDDCRYVQIARYILSKGFNVNSLIRTRQGNKVYDTTLLIFAIINCDVPMISLLLEFKPNLSIVDENGGSALLKFDDTFRWTILNPNIYRDTDFAWRTIHSFIALRNAQRV